MRSTTRTCRASPPTIRNLTSNCVFKIPDTGLPPSGPLKKPQQIGVEAGLVPTFSSTNFQSSIFPALLNPRLAGVQVYLGDLGIDAGTPQNVYVLDTSKMKLLSVKGPGGSNPPLLNPFSKTADSVTGPARRAHPHRRRHPQLRGVLREVRPGQGPGAVGGDRHAAPA